MHVVYAAMFPILESVLNHRLDPISEFLYWHMNWHLDIICLRLSFAIEKMGVLTTCKPHP